MSERDAHTQTFPEAGDAGMAPLQLFSPGMRLGNRYEIRRVIDWGGFAVVYVAHDRTLHREIALKVLRPDRMTEAAMARFRREVAVARDAASPRLVRVFDIETSDGAIYLTMELVDGGSLRQRLDGQELAIEEVIRIAIGIAEGLQALHALGIVHRDVKPGNVLLDSSGEVKLADFGLARHLEADTSRATTTGTIVGTLAYLSPEQALGHPIDHRADLYSLGVAMFEMLTGSVPCEGESALGTLLARMKASPEDVRRLRTDCPRWLAAVVARLLERDPDQRYPTAAAVLADLRRRRSAFAPRRLIRPAAILFVLLFATAAAFVAWRSWRWRTDFSHFVWSGDTMSAVSRSGRVLWRLEGYAEDTTRHYAVLEHGHDGAREIAVVLRKKADLSLRTMHTLSFLDPRSGAITRTVRLPDDANRFAYLPARYAVGALQAIDIDDDGSEEVLTTFIQLPEWPSYITLYEPHANRARLVLSATGHHYPAGATDLDGDGRKELLVYGIHNAWGWQNAVGAVRLLPAVNAFDEPLLAAVTPDMEPTSGTLLWYTYLPRGRQDGVRIDRDRDALHVRYSRDLRVTLTLGGVDRRLTGAAERAAARDRAFGAMRDARRLTAAGSYDEALSANDAARRDATAAGMPQLAEAAQIMRGRVLVAASRIGDAEAHYENLWRRVEAKSDLCLDAAERFHLAGDLDRALFWYRRALRLAQKSGVGRSPHEVVKGLTLAAAEARRFEEGQTEVARFLATEPENVTGPNRYYREYLRWCAGETPESLADLPVNATDLTRYWSSEFALARGVDAETVLRQLPLDLEERSPARSGVLAIHAELLAGLGRRDEARRLIATALRLNNLDRATEIIARSQTDIVRQRYDRLMRD